MFRKSLSLLFVALFLFFTSSFASAATLSIVDSGNGVYTVQGSGMDGVNGLEFNVNYDKTALSSPTVKPGSLISGALMMPNTNNPGSIIIAIVSTKAFSGSGPVAIISFGNRGTGNVQLSIKKMIDEKGGPVAHGVESPQITKPGLPFSESKTPTAPAVPPDSTPSIGTPAAPTSTVKDTSTTPEAAPATSSPTSMGSVVMPGDSQPMSDAKAAESAIMEPPQQPAADAEAAAAAAEPPAIEKPAEPAVTGEAKQTTYGSVLERFRTYQGEKSPATMTALFAKAVAPSIHQEPAIAISDGKTNVRIIVDLPASAASSPNFALSGARMVSLKKGDTSGRWILEALPNKNTLKASVTILSGNSVIEYPLTTVSSGVHVSAEEADFADFLKGAASKAPKRDLNNDGKLDYQDDFIYTALYLIRKK